MLVVRFNVWSTGLKKVLVLDDKEDRRYHAKNLLESLGESVIAQGLSVTMPPISVWVIWLFAHTAAELQTTIEIYPGVPILLHKDSTIDPHSVQLNTLRLVRLLSSTSREYLVCQMT